MTHKHQPDFRPSYVEPEDVGGGGGAHREPGMARVGLLDGVHRQEPDCIDAELMNRVLPFAHGALLSRVRSV